MATVNKSAPRDVPIGNLEGFRKYLRNDLISGLQVFLIALPLCLGISMASGFPPLAGIFTAIIGALLTTFISNSELTIKGPAAGMIVIVLGCVTAFGGGLEGGFAPDGANLEANMLAYRSALAVGVVAAVIQMFFGIFRAGILGEFFPTSAVHGMLAAIGVIIIAKQIPVMMGIIGAKGEPLELLKEIPHFIATANPAIAAIGIVSLLIMFLWPLVRAKVKVLKPIPAPLIVLLVAVPMGMGFDLLHQHSYLLQGHEYQLSEQYLVRMPNKMFGMFNELAFPEFSALKQLVAWKWVAMFFIIGSLESLLSAKAVDMLDPWKRKSNLNRDMLAVGTANLAASFVGGLPMISEIVRSRANIDNGARTRFADMWHGVFLLVCVAMIPTILHRIPLAALAAMLVYTGFRLAHPNEFMHVYRIGREQFLIFVTTLIAVLATDLLVGIGIGIALKFVIHAINGVPPKSMFKPFLEVQDVDENTSLILARESAVFSNWIPFRRQIEQIGLVQKRNLIVDVSDTNLVDHSVMEKLDEMKQDFEREGLTFEVRGLDELQPLSQSSHAARRRRGLGIVRRLTIVADQAQESWLEEKILALGATGFTVQPCEGVGRRELENGHPLKQARVRLEVIVTQDICDEILEFLQNETIPEFRVTICVETVNVVRVGAFTPAADKNRLSKTVPH
jgi:MFS superfamily sulfate permease-like transporter